jgi:hypothetical protein
MKECLMLEVEGIGLTSAEQQYGDSFSRHWFRRSAAWPTVEQGLQ